MVRCIVCNALVVAEKNGRIGWISHIQVGTCGSKCREAFNIRLQYYAEYVEDQFRQERNQEKKTKVLVPLDDRIPLGDGSL